MPRWRSNREVEKDYRGLFALLRETAEVFAGTTRVITMAYYPDKRQESLLGASDARKHVELFHMMTYDQQGAQHSSLAFASKAMAQGAQLLPAAQLTLGLPFYGRHSRTGNWVTYEDLVQQHALTPAQDEVPAEGGTVSTSLGRQRIYNLISNIFGVPLCISVHSGADRNRREFAATFGAA